MLSHRTIKMILKSQLVISFHGTQNYKFTVDTFMFEQNVSTVHNPRCTNDKIYLPFDTRRCINVMYIYVAMVNNYKICVQYVIIYYKVQDYCQDMYMTIWINMLIYEMHTRSLFSALFTLSYSSSMNICCRTICLQ